MKISWRVTLFFAGVGFFLPVGMLVYYALSRTTAGSLYVKLCPPCITSLALDNANVLKGVAAWLLICASNAVLYAIPGFIISLIICLARRCLN